MMTQFHETQVLNLNAALKQGVPDAYDWLLDWQPVKVYDDTHPELTETNESLVAKTSRPVGGLALSA